MTFRALSPGITSASTSSMPMLLATAAAVMRLSPLNSRIFKPICFKAGHGLGGPGLQGVGRGDHPHGFAGHGQKDGGLALPGQLVLLGGEASEAMSFLGEKGQIAQEHFLALDPGLHPQPRHGLEVLHPGQGQVLAAAAWVTASARGCSDLASRAAAWARTCVGAPALPGVDVGHLGGAPGEGAGLVEDHGGEAVGPLQGLAAPHQDAQFGAPARRPP